MKAEFVNRTTVSLVGMRFNALVGILPVERETAQRLEVDVKAVCNQADQGSVHSGQMFVDYRDIYECVSARVNAGHSDLIEQIATDIASDVVALRGVESCVVQVRKPDVILPGPLGYAQVEVERKSVG